MTQAKSIRLLPQATPETRHFWEGARNGLLVLQRCTCCSQTYFPPRPFCPSCNSTEVETIAASGRARLLSDVISVRSAPGIEAPYSVALVELEEGVRMMSNIVNCPQTQEALLLEMPLRVVFEKQNDDITLPLFEPDTHS